MSFHTWDCGWAPATRVTRDDPPRQPHMDYEEDPRARVRERRRRALIDELIPKVRRLNLHWTDEEVIETAEAMAELRLLDEEIG